MSNIIIITGAASGMGLALSKAYIAQGHTVIATDINEAVLNDLADSTGKSFIPYKLDVSDHEAWEQLIEYTLNEYGKLDMLFNNAGIMSSGAFEDLSISSWQAMININLMGVIYGSRAAYKLMKQQGFGTIVNTASTAGVTPVLYSSSYATSKHGIVGFSNSLRMEAKPLGIRVAVVMPGLVDTNIFDSALDDGKKSTRDMADQVPIKKISSGQAAEFIINDLNKGKDRIVFPFVNRLVILLYRLFPEFATKLIAKNQKHSSK